jgi:hypothetical protein
VNKKITTNDKAENKTVESAIFSKKVNCAGEISGQESL